MRGRRFAAVLGLGLLVLAASPPAMGEPLHGRASGTGSWTLTLQGTVVPARFDDDIQARWAYGENGFRWDLDSADARTGGVVSPLEVFCIGGASAGLGVANFGTVDPPLIVPPAPAQEAYALAHRIVGIGGEPDELPPIQAPYVAVLSWELDDCHVVQLTPPSAGRPGSMTVVADGDQCYDPSGALCPVHVHLEGTFTIDHVDSNGPVPWGP